MADAAIPAPKSSGKKSRLTWFLGTRIGITTQSADVILITEDRQTIRNLSRIADRHATLRAKIHARHVEKVKHLFRVFLVVPLDRLLQLCERCQLGIAFQLLLAFAAGEDELAFPFRRVRLKRGHLKFDAT
jgi:hypothetical protein